MKYLNITVFLSLIVLVTGCQKKEQPVPVEKNMHQAQSKKQKKPRLERRGATKMQTRDQGN